MSNPNRKPKFPRAALVGMIATAGMTSGIIAARSPETKPEKPTPIESTTSTTTTSEYVQVGSQELEDGNLTQQLDAPQPVPTTLYRGEPDTRPKVDVEAWKQALDKAQISDAVTQVPGGTPQIRQ